MSEPDFCYYPRLTPACERPTVSAICPKCGYCMDEVLKGAAHERTAQESDFCLCFNCAAILAFTEDLRLRCANAEELEALNFDATIMASQMEIRAAADPKSGRP